eukprot:gnl/Spiro4/8926_TR4716_c0_g1_i1.p1 gnl/Spiro4/8926_TR4716_c0_g1~~gnl/Spiro4/8926_TR4716_c0_g1_i1.p1  ORF type:complete len:218 (-),score=44.12 gnl/Spiro4/8926_TR4716_c0_g1_i1:48-701(-)
MLNRGFYGSILSGARVRVEQKIFRKRIASCLPMVVARLFSSSSSAAPAAAAAVASTTIVDSSLSEQPQKKKWQQWQYEYVGQFRRKVWDPQGSEFRPTRVVEQVFRDNGAMTPEEAWKYAQNLGIVSKSRMKTHMRYLRRKRILDVAKVDGVFKFQIRVPNKAQIWHAQRCLEGQRRKKSGEPPLPKLRKKKAVVATTQEAASTSAVQNESQEQGAN